MEKAPIFLFDKDCTLCSRFVQVLKLIKGYEDFQFIPLQEAQSIDLFKDISEEQLKSQLHIYADSRFHRGPEAVEFLMSRNSLIKKHLWLLDHQMTKNAVKSFYKAVDKARKSSILCGGCNKHS